MNRNLTLSLIMIFSTVCTFGQISSQDEKIVKNYPFHLIIDMNHLQRNNKDNFKYLINCSIDKTEGKMFNCLDSQCLYFIKYKYIPAPEKGFDVYDRMAIDTLKIKLNGKQLENIFLLSTELFKINKSTSILDKENNHPIYDGKYAKVEFALNNYSSYFQVMLSFDQETFYQEKFNELIEYLEEIKNGL